MTLLLNKERIIAKNNIIDYFKECESYLIKEISLIVEEYVLDQCTLMAHIILAASNGDIDKLKRYLSNPLTSFIQRRFHESIYLENEVCMTLHYNRYTDLIDKIPCLSPYKSFIRYFSTFGISLSDASDVVFTSPPESNTINKVREENLACIISHLRRSPQLRDQYAPAIIDLCSKIDVSYFIKELSTVFDISLLRFSRSRCKLIQSSLINYYSDGKYDVEYTKAFC